MFFVGSVCASRTEVYHALKHFKYHLFVRCRTALEAQKEAEQHTQKGDQDEPVKERVTKVFNKLMEEGWITEVCVCVCLLFQLERFVYFYINANESIKMDIIYTFVLLSMQQFDEFQERLNAADFFQEEKLD